MLPLVSCYRASVIYHYLAVIYNCVEKLKKLQNPNYRFFQTFPIWVVFSQFTSGHPPPPVSMVFAITSLFTSGSSEELDLSGNLDHWDSLFFRHSGPCSHHLNFRKKALFNLCPNPSAGFCLFCFQGTDHLYQMIIEVWWKKLCFLRTLKDSEQKWESCSANSPSWTYMKSWLKQYIK